MREYGLGPGRWRLGLVLSGVLLAVMLPIVLVAARLPAFAARYPLAPAAGQSLQLFVAYETGYVAYFVAWEHMFRAFLLVGLYRRIGLHAVSVTTLAFVLVHFGKPEAETLGSAVAGVVLGLAGAPHAQLLVGRARARRRGRDDGRGRRLVASHGGLTRRPAAAGRPALVSPASAVSRDATGGSER